MPEKDEHLAPREQQHEQGPRPQECVPKASTTARTGKGRPPTVTFSGPARLDLSHKVILYLDDISVSFDGFKALNKLNLVIDAGELRCIIGPNGAGKNHDGRHHRQDAARRGRCFFGQTIDLTA